MLVSLLDPNVHNISVTMSSLPFNKYLTQTKHQETCKPKSIFDDVQTTNCTKSLHQSDNSFPTVQCNIKALLHSIKSKHQYRMYNVPTGLCCFHYFPVACIHNSHTKPYQADSTFSTLCEYMKSISLNFLSLELKARLTLRQK